MPSVLDPILCEEELDEAVVDREVRRRPPERNPSATQSPPAAPRGRRRGRVALVLLVACVCGLAGLAMFARGRGYKTALLRSLGLLEEAPLVRPSMIASRPCHGAANVPPATPIVIKLYLPNGKVDPETLTPAAARLTRAGDGSAVDVVMSMGDDGQILTVRPAAPLIPDTR